MFEKYDAVIFDCDGVLFNSNTIKEELLRDVLLNFDFPLDVVLLSLEVNRGRNRKVHFDYCLKEINNKSNFLVEKSYPHFNKQYGLNVRNAYSTCERFENLSSLKSIFNLPWAVISSSDGDELKAMFDELKIIDYFDFGICGGSLSKQSNYEFLLAKYGFNNPLFIGDGLVDVELCEKNNIDLLFLEGWTSLSRSEVKGIKFKYKYKYSYLSDLL